MANAGKAGSNEKKFLKSMAANLPGTTLKGKRRFAEGDVTISVDQSLIHDGITYLIEIDSGNMAKLLVGQYVLLKALYPGEKDEVYFVVIHTYTDYNPQRTINNLRLVNDQLYGGLGIRFGVIHINDITKWSGGDISGFLSLLHK